MVNATIKAIAKTLKLAAEHNEREEIQLILAACRIIKAEKSISSHAETARTLGVSTDVITNVSNDYRLPSIKVARQVLQRNYENME